MSYHVYTLTSLTGRKRNVGRTVIINGFEFGRRALLVTSIAVGAALIPSMILAAFFGPLMFVLVPGLFIATAFVLFEARTRNGLQVHLYRSILDKKRANTDEVYICFRPAAERLGSATIVHSSVPVTEPEPMAPAPVFTEQATTRRASRGRRSAHRANPVTALLDGGTA